jgi:Nif-specific regulatory protein
MVAHFEKELIVEALSETGGNQTKAARQLDTSLRIINYKIKKYGINAANFKKKS